MDKILVIVDVQNDFITGPLGNAECEAAVPEILKQINSEKYSQIILTRDTHGEDYLETQEGKNLPVVHCIKDTDGWQIVDEVMAAVDASKISYQIINKPSFGSLEFGKFVEENSDCEYDFVGVCTGICVISNAMIAKASAPEAKLNIIAKCCACVTPESHETALNAMKLCQMNIVCD